MRPAWVFTGLLAVPGLLQLWAMLFHYKAWFWDAGAYVCGIEAAAINGDPNAYVGDCSGYPWEYMYPPLVTRLLVWLTQALGESLLAGLYVLTYGLLLVGLLIRSCQLAGSGFALRLFLTAACGVFLYESLTGNLAVIAAGAMVLALGAGRNHLLAQTAVAFVAALFKPHYALWFLVPAFVSRRLIWAALPSALLTACYLADALLHAEAFDRWLALLFGVIDRETHFGFMKLFEWASPLQQGGLYLLIAGSLLALAVRRLGTLDPEARAFLALGLATLLFPRLKEYDLLVLIPLLSWLAQRLPSRTRAPVLLLCHLPWALWLGRKVMFLLADGTLTMAMVVDMRWLVAWQGLFPALALLLVVAGLAVRPHGPESAPKP